MPEMKTIKFPGSDNVYEVTDAAARQGLEDQAGLIQGVKNDLKTTNESIQTLNDEVDGKLQEMQQGINAKMDGAYVDEDGRLVLTANGEIVAGPFEVAGGGGGGGGSSNNAVLTLTNTTGWLAKTVSFGSDCEVTAEWSSVENEIATGAGVMKITVNGAVKHTQNVQQGPIGANLKDYLSAGSNTVRLTVSDVYGNSRTIAFSINAISLVLERNFDPTPVFTGEFQYIYTPIGAVEKTVHFILDGTEIGTQTVTASGRQQTYNIPAQSHGSHSIRVYFTAEVEGETVSSNDLYDDVICAVEGDTTPIIASTFRTTQVEQYTALQIEHRVYDPASLTAAVTYWANGNQVANGTVDRTSQIWTYRPDDIGALTLEIRCGDTKKPFSLTVSESSVQVEAETQNLALYLSSYGRSNNEDNPGVWQSGSISAQFSGFNWVSDGWQRDEDGNTVLRVGGDARLTIPYNIFGSDFRSTGKTIELQFASRDVLNYDAVILSCMSGGRGIEVTAQQANLYSEQSKIGTQYKEDQPIRLSFVVEKRSGNRLLLIYLNGIMSGIVQYPTDDDFAQTAPVGISIGSSECTINLYNIRVYDNNLTRFQIVDNWNADKPNAADRVSGYLANDIFDTYGAVVLEKLPKTLPYLVFQCSSWPQYKGDKKTCSGYYVDPLHPEKSFTFTDAEIDVQGTSSQYYYVKNIKAKYKNGLIVNGLSMTAYAMKEDSIPVSTFTYKTDVASSEGANNVVLAQLFNDTSPFVSPAKEADPRVRQTIDGMPIALFWDSGDGPAFYAKANFNNDKGTPEIFGYKTGDEKWETLNNVSAYAMWQTAADFDSHWKEAFEASYPDGYTNVTKLKALAQWIASTNQAAATNAAITAVTYDGVTYTTDSAACRLAKFKAELEDHFVFDSCVNQFVFTEFFLMVDSRTKNSFPTYFADLGKWTWPIYDADTAMGINNEGALAFGYSLESGDKLPSGADVWNAAGNVFWINFKAAFPDEIADEYKRLRLTDAFSFEAVKKRFDDHQSVWPAAMFNEDGYGKYIKPYEVEGATMYFEMAQGAKELQRDWWLFNRFRYMDAKYDTGDVADDFILMRIYAEGELDLVPYADTYLRSKMGSFVDEVRATRGTHYTLPCRVDAANDLETTIYPASLISEIADLSPFKVGQLNLAKAIKLRRVKIGDGASSYSNGNLTSLTFGPNRLLRYVDVRNCPNLAMAIDMSGCTNIEELYFDGTSITGLSLPNGGQVKKVHYPATLKNLTVLNQRKIAEFTLPTAAYAGIETLRIENSSTLIPTAEILAVMPTNSRVRLIGLDWTMDDAEAVLALYDRLDQMRGLDENGNNADKAVVSGTLHIDSLTGAQLAEMQSRYPFITIDYNHITSYCYFYNYDGSTLLYTAAVAGGADAVYGGSTPSKTSTAQYTYSFVGWSKSPNATSADSDALTNVTADRKVYAAFSQTVRTYTVYFYNGSTLLQTVQNVPYGGSATYTGSTPTYTGSGDAADYEFSGFQPTGKGITGNTSCYAQFKYTGYMYTGVIDGGISEYVDEELTTVGEYAFKGCTNLSKVELPAVTAVKSNAFEGCTSLAWVDLASATSLSYMAFSACTNLSTLILRNASQVCSFGSGILNSTAISKGTGYIYVPAVLIDEYKAADGWSAYASQIRAIEDYPEVWPRLSWGSLARHIEAGDYASVYKIGDLIPLDMGSEGLINMQIAAFNADDLADGSGKAHISFVSKELLKTSKRWNPSRTGDATNGYTEGTGAIGGWEKSELRAYYNNTLLPLIPSGVAALIKPVTKTQDAYDTAGSKVSQTTTETIWPPSSPEVEGSTSLYYALFKNTTANRIKYKVGSSSASWWWLRSANSTSLVCGVGTIGNYSADSAYNANGLALGFCI